MIICGLSMYNTSASSTSMDDMKEQTLHIYVQPNSDELNRPSLEGSNRLAFFIENKSHGISCSDVYGKNLYLAPDFPPNVKEGWQKFTQTYQVTAGDLGKFNNVLLSFERVGLTTEEMGAFTEEFAEFIQNVCKPNFEHTSTYQGWLNEKDSGEPMIVSFYRRYVPSRSKVITGLSVAAITGVLFWSGRSSSHHMANHTTSNITDLAALMGDLF